MITQNVVTKYVYTYYVANKVIKAYRLTSSANVVAAKKSLLDKNLIYTDNRKLYLTDPVLGMWLKR